jgi:hypothetical protein
MYKPINKIPSSEFYEAFEVADDGELLAQWSTPEQRAYNKAHKTCPACKGRGYEVKFDKTTRRVEVDSVGCYQCMGTGAVLR